MNQEIRKKIVDKKVDIKTVEWLSMLGAKNDLTMTELRRMECMDGDNVNLK